MKSKVYVKSNYNSYHLLHATVGRKRPRPRTLVKKDVGYYFKCSINEKEGNVIKARENEFKHWLERRRVASLNPRLVQVFPHSIMVS